MTRTLATALTTLLLLARLAGAQQVHAEFSADPASGGVPLTVQFTDLSTGPILFWEWDLGDGSTSNEQDPEHIYGESGSYTVSLYVVGSLFAGADTEVKLDVIIVEAFAEVDFTASVTSGGIPLSVDFTDTTVSEAPISNWYWTFGDGSWSYEEQPTHTYDEPGVYDVSLRVSAAGVSETLVKRGFISVGPFEGSLGFVASATEGPAPLAVSFTNTTTSPLPVSAWEWDLGDGTTSSEQHPQHTYVEPGVYDVRLAATVGPITEEFVQAGAITVHGGAVGTVFSASTSVGHAPLDVSFSDASVGGVTSWHWDFGDGTTSDEQHPVHVFEQPGLYNVTLTVEGGAAASDVAFAPGGIAAVEPVAFDPPLTSALPEPMASLSLHDVTGDGLADAVSTSVDRLRLWVAPASGSGLSPSPTSTSLPWASHVVGLADVDGDGHQDAVMLEDAGVRLAVLWGDGMGGFTLGPDLSVPDAASITSARLGDMDADDRADVVLLQLDAAGDAFLRVLSGAGPLAPGPLLALSGDHAGLDLVDRSGTGVLDVLTWYGWDEVDFPMSPPGSSWIRTTIVPGDGLGGLTGPPLTSTAEVNHSVGADLMAEAFAGDVNGDGAGDLAVRNQYSSHWRLLGPDFDAPLWVFSSVLIEVAGLADFDLIGATDMFGQGGWADCGAGVLSLLTTSGVDNPWCADLGQSPVAAGDVDGDGRPDLVAASDDGSAWLLWLNRTPILAGWLDLGQGLAGVAGVPRLDATGEPLPGVEVTLALSQAAPTAPAWFVVGFSPAFVPFQGGVLVPQPDGVTGGLVTEGAGKIVLRSRWPLDAAPGLETWFQVWVADPAGVQGWSASNGLESRSGLP
ncbi:MAG: hypothetical protein DRQ55_16445 [Planctomycetota bacterium]|nr:MAG: hypothetical protein DRQ55_16445 [Planctomycetota bacterium]